MTFTTEPQAGSENAPRPLEQVVLAADDTYGAVAAADWLAERAGRRHFEIRIVVAEEHVQSGARPGPGHQIAEGVAWRMREFLAARIPEAATVIQVIQGDIAHGLRVASIDADLVVLGCNRGRVWRSIPLATRSTRLGEDSIRPTVVVPAAWSPSTGPVVVGLPDSGETEVLDWAAAEAASAGRRLLLVRSSVLQRTREVPAAPASTVTLLQDLDPWLLSQAVARVHAAYPDLDVRPEVDQNAAAHELVKHGAHAAMLVVGSPSSPRRASTLRGVLEKAVCPVVVVPDRSSS